MQETRKLKSDLSEYGNQVYDQLFLKRGRPGKIRIVELDLKCSESGYLRSIIFGNPGESKFDGLHLRGKFASRHFSYRAVQAILPVIKYPNCERNCPQQLYQRGNSTNQRTVFADNVSTNKEPVFAGQPWQFPSISRNKNKGRQNRDYTDVVKRGEINKQAGAELNVHTSNYWNPLNC